MVPKKPALGLDPRVDTGFRKRSCSTKGPERDDDSKRSHLAIGDLAMTAVDETQRESRAFLGAWSRPLALGFCSGVWHTTGSARLDMSHLETLKPRPMVVESSNSPLRWTERALNRSRVFLYND